MEISKEKVSYYSKRITCEGLILVMIADGANRMSVETSIVPTLSSKSHPIGKAIGT